MGIILNVFLTKYPQTFKNTGLYYLSFDLLLQAKLRVNMNVLK